MHRADGNDLKALNAGAAFIYRRTPAGSWVQGTTILEYNGSANDHFGAAVALDGNYVTVGAPGDNPSSQVLSRIK